MKPASVVQLATILSLGLIPSAQAVLDSTETATHLILRNDRLYAAVRKSSGAMSNFTLDSTDMLGPATGSVGVGPYLDCYCTPAGFYTPGKYARYKLVQGIDSSNIAYGGIVMSDTHPTTGQVMEQYWFLRDGETGLHMFSRLAYYNETTPFLRNLQEMRTLFRPNTTLWTHLSTNSEFYAPTPLPNPAATGTGIATTVQDATWYLGDRPNDPYVQQTSDYFTKYTFQDTWRNHDVHGLYADGSTSPAETNGAAFGAWQVMNTKDTYYGGPTHSDLVVDGIVYNYISSNHHGDQVPNITNGFDRTFGPSYFYLNKGPAGTSLDSLRSDAAKYADPSFAASFYDDIAQHVPGYTTTSQRGRWQAKLNLPQGASNAIAVLSENGVNYQDNVFDSKVYQYWSEVDHNGKVSIDRVKAGTYRLTVYAAGVFGFYEQDGIVVIAGQNTDSKNIKWDGESAGTELWRIGTPDLSSGEYRHGDARDPTHPLQPPEYRIYWGEYDFINDFPDGINFVVGKSNEATDWNYVHWSVFGGYANFRRPKQVEGNGEINNWTVTFDLDDKDLKKKSDATFTVQLAGAKTAAGNTDLYNATEMYSNLPLRVAINGHDLEPWIIPYNQSSSCAARSAVICYNLANKWKFPASYLSSKQSNNLVLSLPFNGTNYESALLPRSVYVQYDALRLEVD